MILSRHNFVSIMKTGMHSWQQWEKQNTTTKIIELFKKLPEPQCSMDNVDSERNEDGKENDDSDIEEE